MFRILLILGFLSLLSCRDKNVILHLDITNPSSFDRNNEMVSLNLKDYFRGAQLLAENIVLFDGNTVVPCQFVDYNKDGDMDKLFFKLDLKKEVTKHFHLSYNLDSLVYGIENETSVSFRDIERQSIDRVDRLRSRDTVKALDLFECEGPIWGNENIVFRNFYDERNIIDILSKKPTNNDKNLDVMGQPEAYTRLLDVGNSMGIGSIALNTKDTIFRIGESAKSSYKQIANGPLKAVLTLDYINWMSSGNNYSIKHEVSIESETYYCDNEILVSGVRPNDRFVTGLMKSQNLTVGNQLHVNKEMEGFTILYTHCKQGVDSSYLGMGLLVADEYFEHIIDENYPTVDIDGSYFVNLKFDNKNYIRYRSYAGWEGQDTLFRSQDYFLNMIKRDVISMTSPLKIWAIPEQKKAFTIKLF